MDTTSRSLRCAIYTRKSTEEGLEQDFNTLQAQREAAESYIRSQHLSGWTALPDRFDDGGFTGAKLDRPGLTSLLEAIEAGKLDCVVVYKVDRLSRSLLDFARLMALFERYGVSFVSVTQEFNTTTSIGRLTLNILLSFAQFEREIIGERTRDKLGAARKKGKWIGGIPVLGYDVEPGGGRLVVNKAEARRVSEIFAIAQGADSLSTTLQEVHRRQLRTKSWTSRAGRVRSGKPFCASSLGALLRNVLYKGCISHKGTIYPGEQAGIVDAELWEKVNRKLALRSLAQVGKQHQRQQALLLDLVRCGECRSILMMTYTKKQGHRHSYYVCPRAKQRSGCIQRPVAAQDLEAFLIERLKPVLGVQPSTIALQQAVQEIVYSGSTRELVITLQDGARIQHTLPLPSRRGVVSAQVQAGKIPRISKLMALAIKINAMVEEGKARDYAVVAFAGSVSRPRLSQIISLTHLAPEIQETLLFLPKTMVGPDPITERKLRRIAQEVDWAWQKKLFQDLRPSW